MIYLLQLLLMSLVENLEGEVLGQEVAIFLRLLLHSAKLPRRKVVWISSAAARNRPPHCPCWLLEFLLISINLIGENVILLSCICISLITRDVEHLFPMFMSHLHFSPGSCLDGFSSPPNTELLNRKQHRKPAAPLCCHGASARVFEVWVWNRLLLFPLIFLVLIIFSPVISLHSLCLPPALVSLQIFHCTRWQSWQNLRFWKGLGGGTWDQS